MKHLGVWGMAAGLLLSGCQKDISGTYLASDKGAVCWLQLVRTPDSHLSGQLATSVIEPDGTVHQDSAPITGAVDGGNVTVSATRFLGLDTRTLSGTLEGDRLTLSGPEGTPFVLRRADVEDYQHHVAELRSKAGQVVAAKKTADTHAEVERAMAQITENIDNLVVRMQRFDNEADLHLSRFSGAETHYQDLTRKMESYVSRQRELIGSNAGVARSQLAVAATQVSVATDQMHIQAQNLKQTFASNVTPIAAQLTTLEQTCRNGAAVPAVNPDQLASRQAACQRLLAADPPFRQRYEATAAGLDHLEQVYLQQQKAQQGLLQAAQAAE